MASDTAPAAVPAPHDPPPPPAHAPAVGPAQPARSGLAGLLAAVEPARPAFDLPPATTEHDAATDGHGGGGASSADFDHDPTAPDTAPGKDGKNGSGQQQGVIRTWMLALAKRHEQAGAARLKALDINKARATALQVKEQRTTNRSEKIVGGNTGTSTNTQAKADKNTGTRTNTSASKGDHKNHRNHDAKNNRTNQPGRGGTSGGSGSSGGHGAGGGKGPGGGRGTGNTNSGTDKGAGKGTSKPSTPKHNGSGSGTGSGAGGGKGFAGKDGSSGKPGPSGKDKPKTTTSTCGTGSGIDMTKPRKDTPKAKDAGGGKSSPGPAGGAGGAAGPAAPGKTQPPSTKPDLKKTPDPNNTPNGQPKNPAAVAPDTKKPATLTKDPKQPTTGTGQPGQDTGRVAIDTQPAREAGYAAGTRIGGIEAQLGALRDGIRDARTDVKEAADREKARLDKAHQDWKNTPPPTQPTPTAPPKPATPPKPTHAPTVPAPKDKPVTAPVQVNSVNGNTINLGDGAARTSMNRGEVRTLRGFQKRLNTKTNRMTRVAEATRTLEQHAIDQARQVTVLRELAAEVKGGEKLLTALSRLEEAATIQAAKAAIIHKRAARAAESCRALKANTHTRYGGIYKAVVDSPETTPAEMSYYREMGHG